MREDDDFGHYVPLLRRMIILVAVIVAVPVILWTITVFVRTYVGPPHIPTFHQLASTASINAPSSGTGAEAVAQLQPGTADGSGAAVQGQATVADARDGAAPKGSMLSDQSADASAPGASRTSDPSGVFPPSPLAATDGNAAEGAVTSAQSATSPDDDSESLSAGKPLSGPVPLPRRRPRDIEIRTADNALSNVPMPRRRPDSAGPGAPAETTGTTPIGFIQNLFH
jgi:hypothetical protein